MLFSPIGRSSIRRGCRSGRPAPARCCCAAATKASTSASSTATSIEISLGDFVLSGGELAALALLDAVARLQPGVLGDADSHQYDSFPADGLLDCPHYSRPEDWEGIRAPAELLSGHHLQIARWRRDRRLELTARNRPDLIVAARAAGRLSTADEAILARLA